METAIRTDLFEPEAFRNLVLRQANENVSASKILKECQEARPADEDCIPWLGEPLMVERIVRLCAQGRIAIDNRGLELLQAKPGETEEQAWARMRGKIGGGSYLDSTWISLPHGAPAAHGSGTTIAGPAQPNLFPNGNQPSPPTSPGEQQPGGGQPPGGMSDSGGTTTGDIFGPGGGARKTYQSEQPTSALNLLQQIEKWGVNAGAKVTNVTLNVNVSTGAQLATLIKKLPPDGLLWELQIDKED
jgi:hypothetical protein